MLLHCVQKSRTVTSMVSRLTTEDAHRRTSGWKTPHSGQRRADGIGSAPVITTLPLECAGDREHRWDCLCAWCKYCWDLMLSIFIVDFLWKSAVEVYFYVIIVRGFSCSFHCCVVHVCIFAIFRDMTCQVCSLEVAHTHFAHELVVGRNFRLKIEIFDLV